MLTLSSGRSSWQCLHGPHWKESFGWLNSSVRAQLKRCSEQSDGTAWSRCTVAYLFAARLETGSGSLCCIMTEMQGDSWPIRGWLTPTFTSPLIYSLSNALGMRISDVGEKKMAKHGITCTYKKTTTTENFAIFEVAEWNVCMCVKYCCENRSGSLSIGRTAVLRAHPSQKPFYPFEDENHCMWSKKEDKRGKRAKLKTEEVGEDIRRNTEGGLSLISGRWVQEIRPRGKASWICLFEGSCHHH